MSYSIRARSLGIDEGPVISIWGQARADFFKSLHESAKSATGELLQTFCKLCFMKCTLIADLCTLFLWINFFHAHFLHTFCTLFLWIIYSHVHFLHTFCTLSAANESSSADIMHTYSVFADFLQIICTLLQRT